MITGMNFLSWYSIAVTIGNAQLTGPVATSVLVDTEAQLNCIWPGASQSSDWLEWGFTNASGYHRIYISINSNVFPSMSQDYGIERINETGEFNLIVKNVTYELASRRLHACSLVQAPVTQSAIIVAVGTPMSWIVYFCFGPTWTKPTCFEALD